jgi:hypothetical protein
MIGSDLKNKLYENNDSKQIIIELAYFGGEHGGYNCLMRGKCTSIDITKDSIILYGDAEEDIC